jgi:hypothetical protein
MAILLQGEKEKGCTALPARRIALASFIPFAAWKPRTQNFLFHHFYCVKGEMGLARFFPPPLSIVTFPGNTSSS